MISIRAVGSVRRERNVTGARVSRMAAEAAARGAYGNVAVLCSREMIVVDL